MVAPGKGTEVAVQDAPVFGLLTAAADKGMSLEDLKELFSLQKEIDARNARMGFYRALAAFRAECPQPKKTRENAQFSVTRNGVKRSSMYAPLEEIDRVAGPVAAAQGLSWIWDTRIEGELMHVTCKLFHQDGHTEHATVSMPYESKAGASPQQKYGSTQTYGMRYSLIAALGITSADEDVDGVAGGPVPSDPITEAQAADLEALIQEVGTDKDKLLAWVGAKSLAEFPASELERVTRHLEGKRGQDDS